MLGVVGWNHDAPDSGLLDRTAMPPTCLAKP